MRIARYFFLSAISCLVLNAHAAAQDRNSIVGFVFDENRRPVSQAYVELQNDLYVSVARTRTQGSGMYTFTNLPANTYYVKVLGVGTNFEDQTKSVSLIPISVIQGRGTASEQVDFYLKVKRTTKAPLAAPAVVFAQEAPKEAQTLYEQGVNDLSNGNEAGLQKIKRSIEIFPDYYLALDKLGVEYVARGHFEAAYVLLTKALSINPRSFSSTLNLGLSAFRLGLKDVAVERFRKAVELEKTSINAHLWLGITLHSKQDLNGSLAALLEANKLSDGSIAEVHWQLARVYKDQKRFSNAAEELELFLKHRPDAQNAAEIRTIIESLRRKT